MFGQFRNVEAQAFPQSGEHSVLRGEFEILDLWVLVKADSCARPNFRAGEHQDPPAQQQINPLHGTMHYEHVF